jgi:soluble lytic murein transglycosylase-like protein
MLLRLLLIGFAFGFSTSATSCWEKVASHYGIDVVLLAAVAKQESNFNPNAINFNKNGTRDIGLMQINSLWLSQLSKYGIEEHHLYDPCINLSIGAWILQNVIAKHGYNWDAIGRYHSNTEFIRKRYISKLQSNLRSLYVVK